MSKYSSKNWDTILSAKEIEYGAQTRTFRQNIKKVWNTILARIAYRCPSNTLRIKLHRMRGCHIGDNCYIGQYCILDNLAPDYIFIEDNANVNADCMILTHFNPAPRFRDIFAAEIRPVIIKEEAMIAVRCTIMPGVTIGKFATVSAGIVVDNDVPDYNMLTMKSTPKYINLKKILTDK